MRSRTPLLAAAAGARRHRAHQLRPAADAAHRALGVPARRIRRAPRRAARPPVGAAAAEEEEAGT